MIRARAHVSAEKMHIIKSDQCDAVFHHSITAYLMPQIKVRRCNQCAIVL